MTRKERKTAKNRQGTIVAISGGFDPLHLGHIRYINAAKKLGSTLVVILNNDHWLMRKKGYVFMPERDRKEILESLAAVDRVVLTAHTKDDDDMSVCRELRALRPHIFANGGDRTPSDSRKRTSSLNPEVGLCAELHIKTVFNVGRGGKLRSSSQLVNRLRDTRRAV